MAELLQRRDEGADTLAHLEAAERRVALAAEDVSDPFVLNRLKEVEFALWEIRDELDG